MERLTVKRKDGRWALANNDGSKPMEQMEKLPVAIARLAAYEDTGMEPGEIVAMKIALLGREFAALTDIDGVSINRMCELAQAEKDGRLVVLPYITWIIENIERFGREIFLSREEVEAALEKREDADNEAD